MNAIINPSLTRLFCQLSGASFSVIGTSLSAMGLVYGLNRATSLCIFVYKWLLEHLSGKTSGDELISIKREDLKSSAINAVIIMGIIFAGAITKRSGNSLYTDATINKIEGFMGYNS
jgi:hypothetical protein